MKDVKWKPIILNLMINHFLESALNRKYRSSPFNIKNGAKLVFLMFVCGKLKKKTTSRVAINLLSIFKSPQAKPDDFWSLYTTHKKVIIILKFKRHESIYFNFLNTIITSLYLLWLFCTRNLYLKAIKTSKKLLESCFKYLVMILLKNIKSASIKFNLSLIKLVFKFIINYLIDVIHELINDE